MTERIPILGISGMFSTASEDYPPGIHPAYFHDAAACIVADGVVLAAVEEERISRDKHTNRFPVGAVAECLSIAGLALSDLSAVAFFFDEVFVDQEIQSFALDRPDMPIRRCRDLIIDRLADEFGHEISTDMVRSVRHHDSHAAAAYLHSGLEPALVIVMDGHGEEESISVFEGRAGSLHRLHAYPRAGSLGHFYTCLTRFLGYGDYDQYKVMGLASYGDSTALTHLFDDAFSLAPDGAYKLDVDSLPGLLIGRGIRPRRSGEPLRPEHRDFAAAGQRLIETVALHVISYWARRTGLRQLAVAGGVGQNTTLNGRLLTSGMFNAVYVHPAPHDAGSAVGAALVAATEIDDRPVAPLSDARLGSGIGVRTEIEEELRAWSDVVDWHAPADIAKKVAEDLAAGQVIGWAQGRAEFGPRALGARSILADPRPGSNRDRINSLVKKRESFRPFAPIVTAAQAARYFELPATAADYGHMSFVVPVREQWRAKLEAVTHVDGTARVQILRPGVDPLLERVLVEFGAHTGMEVLLNTSFNNYAEPIVHTPRDAITCLVTTELSAIAVGPFLVRRRSAEDLDQWLSKIRVELAPFCELVTTSTRTDCSTVLRRVRHHGHALVVSDDVAAAIKAQLSVEALGLPPLRAAEVRSEVWEALDRRLVRPVVTS
jgi:predicted NodU family carbamoyl transferase